MPALNYEKKFAKAVESFEKRSTIRRAGKRNPPKKGEHIKHYSGMRTKFCRLLCIGVCTEVTPVIITNINGAPEVFTGVANNWIELPAEEVTKLAATDGFESVEAFFAYFLTDCMEFVGHLIEWEPIK